MNIEVRNILTGTINIIAREITGETPSGTINGSNVTFVISTSPVLGSEKILLNGIRQKNTVDYSISANIISFVSAPIPGDIILVDYNY